MSCRDIAHLGSVLNILLCTYSSKWSTSCQNVLLNLILTQPIQMELVNGPHYVRYSVQEGKTVRTQITYSIFPLHPTYYLCSAEGHALYM